MVDGTPFGQYRLLELLGRGGMGEVYRAHDTSTNRTVALKVLPTQLAHDEEFKARFRREAELAAQLTDPHIIPIHGYGEIDGRLYLDMRIVTGEDLAHILQNGGPLTIDRAVGLMTQVAAALESAHSQGLIHRDVKPSNILVTAGDFAYLIDFGIARGIHQTALTGTGAMIGTLAYMSPERLSQGQADARADVYALACVYYECIIGAPPFPGPSPEQQVTGHLVLPPPRPSLLNPAISPQFDDVIGKGMAKNPDDRYQSATELTLAAATALRTSPPETLTHATAPPQPLPAAPRPLGPIAPQAPMHTAPSVPTQVRPPAAPPISIPVNTKGANRFRRSAVVGAAIAVVAVIALVVWLVLPDPASRQTNAGTQAGSTTIAIGAKFDQPGLGWKNPDGTLSGFDVDVATYVAQQLGYGPADIRWRESPSAQRENMIQGGQVEFVVATYSITDARRQRVTFAGPYAVTGQRLLVRADDTGITDAASLQGKRLCSVRGATPAQKIKDMYVAVQLQQYDTYPDCIGALKNGLVDAVTTDELILAGFAAQSPGAFKIVGNPLSEERYGIGLELGDAELQAKINDALAKMEAEGAWSAAFEKNFGPAGLSPPSPPPIDR